MSSHPPKKSLNLETKKYLSNFRGKLNENFVKATVTETVNRKKAKHGQQSLNS